MSKSVEAEGASIDEAVERALGELGVGRDDATVEVLEEGRRGLFGGNRPARVRVTARDGESADEAAATRDAAADDDQGDAVRDTDADADAAADADADAAADDAADADADAGAAHDAGGDHEGRGIGELAPEERMDLLDEEAEFAADFVEGLLDLLDLPGDIEIEVQEEQAHVNVQEVGSGLLIGRRGATLDALQELVRCAVQRQTERRTHVRVDVEGYRSRQLDKLRDKCRDAIAQVRETGEPVRLEPMDAYERKTMHDLVSKTGGVMSSSEGNEPKRRVVIHPA